MELKSFDKMQYHPLSEKIARMMSDIAQNPNLHTFRVMLTYYFGMMASQMRANVAGWQSSKLPINMYVVSLSESGTGKGLTTTKMEKDILYRFRELFIHETFPTQAGAHIYDMATHRVNRNPNLTVEDEEERLQQEFEAVGPLMWSFDDATPAAIKQIRHKMLLANAGSLNFQIDEIGDNLVKREDAIKVFLELYDVGLIKDKLIKNTSETARFERIEGSTPANLLMFGTSSSLLDAGETEKKFMHILGSGYARRCLFSFTRDATKMQGKTAEQLVKEMFNQHHDTVSEELAEHFEGLADISAMNLDIQIGMDECLYLMKYKLNCQERGQYFNEHQAIIKAEMDHRYFKVLKLAAAYAFIDYEPKVTIDHLENAIKLVEDSGRDFHRLMNPEKDYMKLARFLTTVPEEVTLADLDEALPSFKGTAARKNEIIQMATSWGYKQNIIIKRSYMDSILFLRGEALKKTSLDEMIISASDHEAYRYAPQPVGFKDLAELGETEGMHWCNHYFEGEHRFNPNLIPGFNLIVLDIDGTCPLPVAMDLLEGIKCMFYTTKSHTDEEHRYRIIIPTSHILEMDLEEYRTFMNGVLDSFPFEVDETCNQAAKKWLSNKGEVYFNEGELFNVLPFIPKTSQYDKRLEHEKQYENMDGLERWVIENTGDGNRNNQLFKFGKVLAESGFDYDEVESRIMALNNKLIDKLAESEIRGTIMKSLARTINLS